MMVDPVAPRKGSLDDRDNACEAIRAQQLGQPGDHCSECGAMNAIVRPTYEADTNAMPPMEDYLRATAIINWTHPAVRALAESLAAGQDSPTEIARRCFVWVRDQIYHSVDYQLNPVTCAASDVLAARTGFCYAKSHLLVALCRANGIPAGL